MSIVHTATVAVLMLTALACASAGSDTGGATPPTRIAIDVNYDVDWDLTSLEVTAGENSGRVDVQPKLDVLVDDALAGRELALRIVGYRASERWATASTTVGPRRAETVTAELTLVRLPCGAWCTAGSTGCFGDAVSVCEQRDNDDCMEWGTPIECPTDAPFCSLGRCASACIDECAAGETRCSGPDAVQTCGSSDSDPCLDWSLTEACGDGETCGAGRCGTAACSSECGAEAQQPTPTTNPGSGFEVLEIARRLATTARL